jgi:hypothetical protein
VDPTIADHCIEPFKAATIDTTKRNLDLMGFPTQGDHSDGNAAPAPIHGDIAVVVDIDPTRPQEAT